MSDAQKQEIEELRAQLAVAERDLSRLRDAASISKFAAWEVDSNAGSVWWDQAYDRLFGERPPETRSSWDWWVDHIHQNDRARVRDSLRGAIDRGDPHWREEYKYRRSDGTHIRILDRARIQPEGDGFRALGVMLDVTQTRNLEEEIHQGRRIQSLGTLAGGVAHELNNILASILGFSELALSDAPAGSDLASHLGQALAATGRGREVVRQLLTFSRREESVRGPLNFRDHVSEVIDLFRVSIDSNVTLETDLEDVGLIYSNALEVHQIVLNLCTNAVAALPPSGGLVGVTLRRSEINTENANAIHSTEEGVFAELKVKDTGGGISKQHESQIFEPFFTTKSNGTGIGLSIVNATVLANDGMISVDSKPGTGTTMSILLPLLADPRDSLIPRQPALGANPKPTAIQDTRVLIVDDDPEVLAVMTRRVERLGYQVIGFALPAEALQAFLADPDEFSVILTDRTMPVMTGEELIRKVHSVRPQLPAAICSGYYANTRPGQSYSVLGKPMTTAELAGFLRLLLQNEDSSNTPS